MTLAPVAGAQGTRGLRDAANHARSSVCVISHSNTCHCTACLAGTVRRAGGREGMGWHLWRLSGSPTQLQRASTVCKGGTPTVRCSPAKQQSEGKQQQGESHIPEAGCGALPYCRLDDSLEAVLITEPNAAFPPCSATNHSCSECFCSTSMLPEIAPAAQNFTMLPGLPHAARNVRQPSVLCPAALL